MEFAMRCPGVALTGAMGTRGGDFVRDERIFGLGQLALENSWVAAKTGCKLMLTAMLTTMVLLSDPAPDWLVNHLKL